ncbi:MAG: hypothetical protein GWM98_27780 [Nitrospinaceae bacterium]|nr:hypothetical protein [Nitrospinaceae bacterium]NIR57561.1 hypothetical protein [Nitrospinaceae bacterium]NIS88031.1 hypothetical protein [Nitrospinaceae bacterium]NIT84895.1 hypothetical protein [Nitrospinaceae bacterium]NIU47071.1 hypothetical protein [Nitrospinaceae bacterium]
MQVGDKIKVDFAGKKKDAVVHKLFPNQVYLKMDFDRHLGKIVKRKLSQVESGKSGKADKTKKKAAKSKKKKS